MMHGHTHIKLVPLVIFICDARSHIHQISISSFTLRDSNPRQMGKKRQKKATVFTKHLANVFQPHAQETDEEILEFLEPPAQSVEPIKPFTPKEIKEEIGLLNTKKKSLGMDLITPKMLQELPQKGMILLTYSFNAILNINIDFIK